MTQAFSEIVRPTAQIEAAGNMLEEATPEKTLRWAFDEFQERVTIATGFGAEGVALIDMAVRINPNPDIFFSTHHSSSLKRTISAVGWRIATGFESAHFRVNSRLNNKS